MFIRSIVIFNMVAFFAGRGVMHLAYAEQLKKTKDVSDVKQKESQTTESRANEFTERVTGIQFVKVPGVCFSMGDTFGDGEKDEMPVHKVCVTDFAISKNNVTVSQYRLFVEATSYRTDAEKGGGCYIFNDRDWNKQTAINWQNPSFKQTDQHPVTCVSWNDAQAFTRWLNKLGTNKYRLPTEAEWEYAARSGGKKERFAGFSDQSQLYKYANFCDSNCEGKWKTVGQNDGYSGTSPVGNYLPNGLGLHDMTGNVWQWSSDRYNESFYSKSPKNNPQGTQSGYDRVVRGGSWLNGPNDVRAAGRNSCSQDYRSYDIGFRIVSPVE